MYLPRISQVSTALSPLDLPLRLAYRTYGGKTAVVELISAQVAANAKAPIQESFKEMLADHEPYLLHLQRRWSARCLRWRNSCISPADAQSRTDEIQSRTDEIPSRTDEIPSRTDEIPSRRDPSLDETARSQSRSHEETARSQSRSHDKKSVSSLLVGTVEAAAISL
jgi:hypothetical protein